MYAIILKNKTLEIQYVENMESIPKIDGIIFKDRVSGKQLVVHRL